jgi:hypothetical protein
MKLQYRKFLLPILLFVIFIAFYKNYRIINESFTNKKYTIQKSKINGVGIFATTFIPKNQKIDIAFFEENTPNGSKRANMSQSRLGNLICFNTTNIKQKILQSKILCFML